MLAAAGGEVPYTHDLRFRLDIAVEHHVTLPSEVAESDWLTPWAVAARYGADVCRTLVDDDLTDALVVAGEEANLEEAGPRS